MTRSRLACSPKRRWTVPPRAGLSHLEPMLKEYYRSRGWDENGNPTPKKLADLGLAELQSAAQFVKA